MWIHNFLFAGMSSKTEHALVYDLFEGSGYNPLIRPAQNTSEAITVSFGVTLFQVISVVWIFISPYLR